MVCDEKSKLKALSDIASIDITHEFGSILQNILKITYETMNAHSCTMMLIEENNKLKMMASYGLAPDYPERVHEAAKKAGVPLTFSPSGVVLETGKCYIVPNVFDEPRCKPWDNLAKEFGFSSQIFTPMKTGLKIIGLLNVYMVDPHQFTEEEINFVAIAASQASYVIENARMCRTLKNNISELNDYKENLEKKIKETHKRLYESEAKFRDLFENASDFIWASDAEGYLITINNAGLKIFGCKMDEIIGTHFTKWFTPDSIKIVQDDLKKHISGEKVEQSITVEIVSKNGEHRWLEIRTGAINEENGVKGLHGIGRDITEKRRLEQELREYNEKLQESYEELKEADRIKTEFISNITHELFTPMTSIKGFAELLRDETMGNINDEQQKSLEIILRNSDRLIRLIKELLDAAHLKKNRMGLQFGLVSLNSILSKSIQDIHPQAKDKHITIIQDIQPLPRVWGDEERLMEVMTNLLSNAIKFTPQKGKITVAAGEDTNHVNISVADTGIGIPAEKLSCIFDRFYQVDGSTSRKYGGVGLGLSICKGILEKHKGSIRAESNGNGSTFHITLPKLAPFEGEWNVQPGS
ncbi:MAG: ATP-binding protein [Candidatus Methanoperedens sp.]|nr:ATP-binding protein [Candidatus Methanoperedens sp.]